MYDQIQTALTITIEVIALIGFIGLPIHAIVTHPHQHCSLLGDTSINASR
jgi:hypothetical protein